MKRTPMAPRTKPMKRGTKPLNNGNGWHPHGGAQKALMESEQTYKVAIVGSPRHVGPEYRYGARLVAALFRPVPKDNPLQHEGYMAAVRKLPCYGCGVRGLTQFCHADILGAGGKGQGIKSDCRLGWPGCGPSPLQNSWFTAGDGPTLPNTAGNGCHWYVGTSGQMPKLERHEFEAQAGRETRATIKRMGLWPADLPDWPES